MPTNRELGDAFDGWLLEQLAPYVRNVRHTLNSGALFGDQDLVCDELRISCKMRWNHGLTRREILEPYIEEPVTSLRAAATALRWASAESLTHYMLCDAQLILQTGRSLLDLAIQETFEDWEIVSGWPHGINRTLVRTLGPLEEHRLLLLMQFHAWRSGFFCHLQDFISLLAWIQELSADAAPNL